MNKQYTKLIVLSSAFILWGKGAIAQQELQGSQFLTDKTYINPAFAGSNTRLMANVQYQATGGSQTSGADNKLISAAASFSLPSTRATIGFNAVKNTFGNDSYGVTYGNYTYHLPLSQELVLSSAIGLGLQQYNINLSNLTTANPLDPLAKQNIYSSKLDARFGLAATLKGNFYAGISFDNIFSLYTSKESFAYQIPSTFRKINMYATLGAKIPMPSDVTLMPSLLLIQNMGGITSIDINTMVLMQETIGFGFGFRQRVEEVKSIMEDNGASETQAVLRGMLTYQIKSTGTNKFRIGYCYNYSAAKTGVQVGSHDLSLAFNIP